MAAEQELLLVVGAGDSLGRGFGSGQRRQQEARQDGDDGDDHQQFNQRESLWRAVLLVLSIHKPKQEKCQSQINCASNQFYPDSRKTQVGKQNCLTASIWQSGIGQEFNPSAKPAFYAIIP